MTLIKKTIEVEVQVGDEIKAPNSIFRKDLKLYVWHIDGDLLYINNINAPKDECETAYAEDCYLI